MNTGGALVIFWAGDLGEVGVTLEAWVEKRGYFWTVIPTSLGTGRACIFILKCKKDTPLSS